MIDFSSGIVKKAQKSSAVPKILLLKTKQWSILSFVRETLVRLWSPADREQPVMVRGDGKFSAQCKITMDDSQ